MRVFQGLTAKTYQLHLNLSGVRKLHGSMKHKCSAGSQACMYVYICINQCMFVGKVIKLRKVVANGCMNEFTI